MMRKLPLAWKRNQQEMVACYLPGPLSKSECHVKKVGLKNWNRKRFLCFAEAGLQCR